MNRKIYILTHNRPRAALMMLPEPKRLGHFFSVEDAVDAIKNHYITKPGFKDHLEDFMIEEFIVGDTDWLDGFDGPVNIAENLIYKGGRPDLHAQKFTSKPGEPYFAYTLFTKKSDSETE